jgi:hypothetical protein
MYSMQLCVVNLWLYVVWVFLSCLCVLYTAVCCQPFIVCYLYVLSGWYVLYVGCVLSTFDSMLYEGFCHDYIYSIPLCDVNLWLHFVFVGLSWAYVLYTAVCCQPLILCFLSVFSGWYVLYASCVLLMFDSMLYEGFCHEYIYYIQLCDVNLWLHFVFVVLSWAYILCTAVCCQPLIVCCTDHTKVIHHTAV